MNIEQAKTIPLALILERLGYKPTKERNNETVYFSPFREERTASFHVHNLKNIWYDFGQGIGGNTVDFAVSYLQSRNEDCNISDALRWLTNMSGHIPTLSPVGKRRALKKEHKLIVKEIASLKHPALVGYLKKRGIPLKTAASYLSELHVLNKESNKTFFALGFENEEEGFEIRNPYFKGCAGTKAISFIRGKQAKPEAIHIFEGCMDYLSAITYKQVKQFEDDTIVLNSLSCLNQALPYMKNYGYRMAYTWLDNDKAGKAGIMRLAEFFRTEDNLRHQAMNSLYLPHKDVNAWHMSKLSLSL